MKWLTENWVLLIILVSAGALVAWGLSRLFSPRSDSPRATFINLKKTKKEEKIKLWKKQNQIKKKAQALRERIRKWISRGHLIVLCVSIGSLLSCVKSVPDAHVDPKSFEAVLEPLETSCKIEVETISCPKFMFQQAFIACVEWWETSKLCLSDLEHHKTVANLDLSQAVLERDQAQQARWYWAIGGVAVGSIIAALVFGLAR